ncbi:hypothetical protein LZ30DRAFT_308504 [Colletotrichum cereale]|nr:hypothetical protein LZ30DRAFT_308504 [Colletotrichum cereale]
MDVDGGVFGRMGPHRRPGPTVGTDESRATVQHHSKDRQRAEGDATPAGGILQCFSCCVLDQIAVKARKSWGQNRIDVHGRWRPEAPGHETETAALVERPTGLGQISIRGSKPGAPRESTRVAVCWGPDRPMVVDERYIGRNFKSRSGLETGVRRGGDMVCLWGPFQMPI